MPMTSVSVRASHHAMNCTAVPVSSVWTVIAYLSPYEASTAVFLTLNSALVIAYLPKRSGSISREEGSQRHSPTTATPHHRASVGQPKTAHRLARLRLEAPMPLASMMSMGTSGNGPGIGSEPTWLQIAPTLMQRLKIRQALPITKRRISPLVRTPFAGEGFSARPRLRT